MGAVYDAVHEDLHRRVAIKVLHPHIAQDASLLERFRREAIAAAELGHPNIIAVSDLQIDPQGLSFMVMERLDGRSLDQVILEGPLTSQRTASIAYQLLSALDAAHSAGIIHRDIKPENVFLTTIASVGDLAKLLDFGIAKLVDTEGEGRLTGTGAILGTPIFMSPEQALGEKVDATTDIYSLGGIMFNAVTGAPPRSGATFGAIFNAILTQPARPVLSLRPDLDPDFAAVIDRALARDAGTRFASAREMAEALTSFLPSGHTTPGFRAVGDPQRAGQELPPSELSTGAPRLSARTAAIPASSGNSAPPSTGDPAPAASPRAALPAWAWIAFGAGGIVLVTIAIIIALSLIGLGDEGTDAPQTEARAAPPPVETDAGDGTMSAGDASLSASDAQPATTLDADSTGEVDALSQSATARSRRARRRRRRRLAARARARRRSRSAESETTSAAPPAKAASSEASAPLKLRLASINCRSGFAPRSVGPIRSTVGRYLGAIRRCASSARVSRDTELFRCYGLTLDSTGKTTSARPTGSDSVPRLDRCVSGVLRRISFPAKIVDEPIANLQLCFRARSG